MKRFIKTEDGNIAIEAVIVLPILFWGYLSMFAIFDAYRQHSINQKAAFTIGDLISRQTTPLDTEFLTGARDLFDMLTRSQGVSSMRVTSVRFDADTQSYTQDWSQALGAATAAEGATVQGWADQLPVMPDNERVMVVETWSDYDPPFNTGLTLSHIHNFVFTRPRYAPRVLWEETPPGS